MRRDEGGLEVHVASTALVGLGTSFDRAIEYPYGCTEQLTSRILPLLVLPEMARAVRRAHAREDRRHRGRRRGRAPDAPDGLGRLRFLGDDERRRPWLSAYAMLAVELARRRRAISSRSRRATAASSTCAGSSMARGSARRTRPRTRPRIRDEAPPVADGDDDPRGRRRTRAYATVAFVADVLTDARAAGPGYLNRLFDARKGRPLFARAMLLHAMAVAHMPESRDRRCSPSEVEAQLRVDANQAFADEADGTELSDLLDSSTRTTRPRAARARRRPIPGSPLATAPRARPARAPDERSVAVDAGERLGAARARRLPEDGRGAAPDFDARVFLGGERLGRSGVPREVDGGRRAARTRRGAWRSPRARRSRSRSSARAASSTRPSCATPRRSCPARPADRGLFVQKLVRAVAPEDLAKAHRDAAEGDRAARAGGRARAGRSPVRVGGAARAGGPFAIRCPRASSPSTSPSTRPRRTRAVEDESTKPGDPKRKQIALRLRRASRRPSACTASRRTTRCSRSLPHVEPGIYHFRYVARATTPGEFVVPPTRAECMYSPEVWGRTAATRFAVADAAPGAAARVARR